MIVSLIFLFVPALFLFGFQSVLESKGINNPTLSISLYKTVIILDSTIKLFIIGIIEDLDTYALISSFAVLAYFVYFVTTLSLNIPKVSFRNNKKYPQETNYTLCAIKVIIWSCLSIFLNITLLNVWTFEDPAEIVIPCIVMICMVVLCIIMAAKALIRLDRLKYPSIRSLNGLSNNNSPIILLRSFKIDSNPTISGKVFDEKICENLDLDKNPIVSLANPDEILPSGGSLKIQAKDSEWKEVVKEILRNCRAVILVEGLSDGLHWEISKLKDFLNPKQLFVMIPSKKYRELAWCYTDEAGTGLYSIMRNLYRLMDILFGNRKKKKQVLDFVWRDFSEKLNMYGIHIPMEYPGDNVLLSFDNNWNSIKSIGQTRNIRSMLDCIISQTTMFNRIDFDYPKLGKKIESYEANGFLNTNDVVKFKNIVDKCNKIGRIISFVFFLLFVVELFYYISICWQN